MLLSTLVGCLVLQSLAAQVPLCLSPDGKQSLECESASRIIQSYNSAIPLDSDSLDFLPWQLDEPPPANATGHFVFETVNSLLQHWPNTRYRNGHAIIPGVVPKGTLLYHGALSDKMPTSPQWTAVDPEHSMYLCRGSSDTGCWHLTLAATRPLKVLYFDGNSAGNTGNGTNDTQDIIAWGELRPDWWDAQRIKDLCKWGAPYAVDGYVRMEMDFEIMLCDFTAGLEVVSSSNLVSRFIDPDTLRKSLFSFSSSMHAGSWHNRYPGATRIILDLAGIVSLYDTTLAPSLVGLRAGQERCDHRIQGISSADIEVVRRSVSRTLERHQADLSGIDWKTLFRAIVERYSGRLDLMDYLLNYTSGNDTILDQASKVQTQLRVMLTPYIFHTIVPPSASYDSAYSWATPVFQACGTAHTSSIASYIASLNPSERLLLRAAQETTREICRITTKMWATGVLAGLDPYLPRDSTLDAAQLVRLIVTWRQELSALMAWLDWSVWVRCRPACGPEEMCYLPSWPVNVSGGQLPFPDRVSSKHGFLMQLAGSQDEEEWRKPQPKCIRRFAPYGF
ncbi:uncharacterized protein EDB91DRAFT_1046099 [Suillus paluster]|uniref:uncharacterized protein n=1 Tax=Suillus paluster TaxID=48578 RepID=UPI001B883F11|nr:uncharacterized protein EDB91DRAFT_1046099 [Suillus paluster]KAG1750388.1 hypothetical protein EDB91DRAFT_1046099 [Suillus paluster]